ncbi:2-succinylbenzoate--CoA ligase [Iningainema tapete]|uniref:2-succinylbenzoate--CoA ligase n=1 Tax=Iningainema tapete BLCC-T55 TaxID=2748662 RepID=A0A8J7BXI9_9CYAN|nr:2-succinylbenzoate--CoA ligase [Iningainema tapete]MBD2773882.1 2-succinylbenzoate--CoA ligase [Iningainema tapete BLCC-T55]
MKTPIEQLRKRSQENWLLGYEPLDFFTLTENFYQKLDNPIPQKILLVEPDPILFLAGFIAAYSRGHHVFLGNPAWGLFEWQQVFDLVAPDLVLGNCECAQQYHVSWRSHHRDHLSQPVNQTLNQASTLIMIPTGGSSGRIRFAMHTWQTLMASVEGFREYFQLSEVNSICVLPLHHVSGLMQFMRTFSSGGQLLILPFKELKIGKLANFAPQEFFISLVPTQLQSILSNFHIASWLSQCSTVLLGGAPAWSELLEKARFYHIRLAPAYGMTETASQIATLKPESFLNGTNGSYQILPHIDIKIYDEKGKSLDSQQIGRIAIYSPSLALGYYPELFSEHGVFYPDDVGFLDEKAALQIIGRSSDKIITGGENVFPSEIETAIRATGLVTDVFVIGKADNYWGQIISAVYVPINSDISSQDIRQAMVDKIAHFKIPKLWLEIKEIPINEQGKVNRQQIQELLSKQNAF